MLPESNLAMQLHNLVVWTHYPLLALAESIRPDTPFATFLFLVPAFGFMAAVWGILIYCLSQMAGKALSRLSRANKIFAYAAIIVFAAALLTGGIM